MLRQWLQDTEDIIARLVEMEESPWGDLKGKPIDSRRLARYLKPYDVKSRQVRIGERTAKGYRREDLLDPWARYLASLPNRRETSET